MSNNYVPLEEDNSAAFQSTEMFGGSPQINNPNQHEISVQIQNPDHIRFEEFDLGRSPEGRLQTGGDDRYPQQNLGFGDSESFVGQQQPQKPQTNARIWSMEYYKFLFDVDTPQVSRRILFSFIPFPAKFFQAIQPNPDMYGPFWIATTLIFIMAAVGNVTAYFSSVNKGEAEKWKYDINKLSSAAGAIYGYLFVIPLLLYAALRYHKVEVKLFDIYCIYGYSLAIYVPVSIICAIPNEIVHWVMIGVAGLVSTSLLVSNFFPVLKGHMTPGLVIIAVMAALHLGFALTAELFFFSY